MKAFYRKYQLVFRRESGTSRGVLTEKTSWFIFLTSDNEKEILGVGECSLIDGLSPDPAENYQATLQRLCNDLSFPCEALANFPSIRFGWEMVWRDFHKGGKQLLFPSAFTQGEDSLTINGLIWMGNPDFMKEQIAQKISQGFRCLKMKIGALNFSQEYQILQEIRRQFSSDELELRVDANGAFSYPEAQQKLALLAELDLHSIEQPIAPGQPQEMAALCEQSPIAIALDEELLAFYSLEEKKSLLTSMVPQYIILKPSLLGGWQATQEWITLAQEHDIGWWVTSALESNVGLNAIAQWTYLQDPQLVHGLGTGGLYHNNLPSPLTLTGDKLSYAPQQSWDFSPVLTSSETTKKGFD